MVEIIEPLINLINDGICRLPAIKLFPPRAQVCMNEGVVRYFQGGRSAFTKL